MSIVRTIFTGFLAMALPAFTALAVQRVEQLTVPVKPGCTVKIDSYRGAINILPGLDEEVQVHVHAAVETEDAEWGRQLLAALEVNATVVDNEVRITVRNPRDSSVRFAWSKETRPEIELTVHVPAHSNLNLVTTDGGIVVDNLRGDMQARSQSGTIFFRQIDGSVNAATESGNVIVSRCTGAVTLKTIQGDVRIGAVGGRAVLETVNGDIEVQTAQSAVTAQTSAGDITAGFANLSAPSKIQTALGNIRARVNPTTAFSLNATSSWGKVTSRMDIETSAGGSGRSKLSGRHLGGGPLLNLRASGGHVLIEAGEPDFAM